VPVPLRGAIDVDRLADLVATLLGGSDGTVTLWGLGTDGSEFDVEAAVAEAETQLADCGLWESRIRAELSVVDVPTYEIVNRLGEFDITVMGETGPSLLGWLFGDPSEPIAEGAVASVPVVLVWEAE